MRFPMLGKRHADARRHDLAAGNGQTMFSGCRLDDFTQVTSIKRFVLFQQGLGDLE